MKMGSIRLSSPTGDPLSQQSHVPTVPCPIRNSFSTLADTTQPAILLPPRSQKEKRKRKCIANVIRLPQILADEPDLTEVVLQALSQAANKPQHPYDHKHSANNNVTPTVWEPEEKADLHTDTQQNEDTQHRPATEPLPTPPRSILQPLSPSAMRDELERLVLQDLLGPAGGFGEELDEGSVRLYSGQYSGAHLLSLS